VILSLDEVAWQENMSVAHNQTNLVLADRFDKRWKWKHTLYAAELCTPNPCPHNYQGMIWQEVCLVNNEPMHLGVKLLGEGSFQRRI